MNLSNCTKWDLKTHWIAERLCLKATFYSNAVCNTPKRTKIQSHARLKIAPFQIEVFPQQSPEVQLNQQEFHVFHA